MCAPNRAFKQGSVPIPRNGLDRSQEAAGKERSAVRVAIELRASQRRGQGPPEGDRFAAGGFWHRAASLVGLGARASPPSSLLALCQNPLRPRPCGGWVQTLFP